MDESPLSSSVKAPLYQACSRAGTSHLIRSQWKPVAPRHHSYWAVGKVVVVVVVEGGRGGKEVATLAAAGAESRDALRKPFFQISRLVSNSRLARVASGSEREVLLHSEQGTRNKILSIQLLPCSF